ncbi:hypothetical protein CEXT_697521 [Caerostris extrusa]|uniref:Uncharacterized protein n=1 Tax=Caerostris extrusa TaxID=172846 RepID=A0AAV4Y181_CAEEX|nr:hypothetical protein CEXT_697521 [Caerostris extrusa]
MVAKRPTFFLPLNSERNQMEDMKLETSVERMKPPKVTRVRKCLVLGKKSGKRTRIMRLISAGIDHRLCFETEETSALWPCH